MQRYYDSDRGVRGLLAVGFILIISLLLIEGFFGFRSLRSIQSAASELAEDQFTQMALVDEVQREQGSLSAIYYFLAADPDSVDRARLTTQLDAAANNIRQIVDKVPAASTDRATWESLSTAATAFSTEAKRLLALEDPPTLQSRELLRIHSDVLAAVGKLIRNAHDKSHDAKDRIQSLADSQLRKDAILLGTSVVLSFICAALVMRITMRLHQKMKEQSEQLSRVSWHLLENHEMVARRLSHELHDELGQNLTALKTNFARHADSHCVDARWMADCTDLLKESIRSAHEISQLLRPTVLDDFGLVAALTWLCERFEERSGIVVEFSSTFDKRLPAESETHVFRIAQEALTNVARHSQATHVTLQLYEKEGEVHLSITDNGKGLPSSDQIRKDAFGLTGMRARAQSASGALNIHSRAGRGTSIELCIPLEARVDEEANPYPVG